MYPITPMGKSFPPVELSNLPMREPQSRFHGVRAAGFLILCVLLTGADVKPGDLVRQDAVAYRMEGRELQAAGEMERASSAFRRAVTLYPQYAEAYNDLGVVLESMGDLENAETAYKSALIEDPELGAAHSNLALLYEEQGRTQDAANHWVARIRLGPPDDPWVMKARERMSVHKVPVEDTPREAAEKSKDKVKLAILQGQIHMDAREWDKAIREFERALELQPGNAKAARYLGAARLKAKEEERKVAREIESSKRNVLKERELVEKDWAMKQKEEARLEADSKRKQQLRDRVVRKEEELQQRRLEPVNVEPVKTRTVRSEPSGKPWWKFWAKDTNARPQPVKQQVIVRKPSRTSHPWWKFWAGPADEEAKQRSLDSKREDDEARARGSDIKRERELEKEMERARKISDAQEEALREADRIMKQASRPAAAPAPKPVFTPPPSPAPKPAPVAYKPPPPPVPVKAPAPVKPAEPAVSSADALKMAQEYAKERSKSTARAEDDLYKRGIAAMREGSYQDAAEHFRQVLALNPQSVDAKNALTRAEKAWEREQQEQGLGNL